MLTTCCANSARFVAAQADLDRQHSQLYQQNKVREVMRHPVLMLFRNQNQLYLRCLGVFMWVGAACMCLWPSIYVDVQRYNPLSACVFYLLPFEISESAA